MNKETILVRLSEDLKDRFKEKCEREGETTSSTLRFLMREYINKE